MRQKKHYVITMFSIVLFVLMFGLSGCSKDTSNITEVRRSMENNAAKNFRKQLENKDVKEIVLKEDVTVMGCLVVNGDKTISGTGTIILAHAAKTGIYQEASIFNDMKSIAEDAFSQMMESSVIYVRKGSNLILSGNVIINSEYVGNGLVVEKGGSVTISEEASLEGGYYCNLYNQGQASIEGASFTGTAGYNIINEGTLDIAGGMMDGNSGYGNIYVADGSATLKGGSILNAKEANIYIAESGELKVSNDVAIQNGTVGIQNYGMLELENAVVDKNFTNILNYGDAKIKESDLVSSVVNNIVNEEVGTLEIYDSNITSSGAGAIVNNKGEVSFENTSIRRTGSEAVFNKGGRITGKEMIIYGSSGNALKNFDAIDGTAGNVEIQGLEIQNSNAMNVLQQSCGTMKLKEIVLGTTSVTNVKLASGTLILDDMELQGTTVSGAGVWTVGGKLEITDSTIKSTKGRGMALSAGKIAGKRVTFHNIVNSGIEVMLHDDGYSSATVELDDVVFDGGERENISTTAKNAKLTIHGGTFGTVTGNNVRCKEGSIKLNSVKILGNRGTSQNHGVYVAGGSVDLLNCTIQDTHASAIRNKGGEVRAKNLTTKNTAAAAISNAYGENKKAGNITIEGIEIVDSKFGALRNDCSGSLNIKKANFGKTAANQIVVTDGNVYIEETNVCGTTNGKGDSFHNVYMTDGYLEMKSVTLKESDTSGIRQKGGKILGENVTISKTKVNALSIESGHVTLMNSVLEHTTRTNVNLTSEKAAAVLDNVKVKGAGDTKGNDSNCIYVAPGAEIKLCGGTVVSGSVTRAGILCSGGKLYIDDAQISDNAMRGISLTKGTVKDEATKATTEYISYARIKNAAIKNNGNNTVSGGAIYNEGVVSIENSVLQGNEATYGGAINTVNGGKTAISNTIIKNNLASVNGGGLYTSANAELKVIGGNIESNNANAHGDAVYVNTQKFYLLESAKIDKNNDIYLADGIVIKTENQGIGNDADNPLNVTCADKYQGLIVIESDNKEEADRLENKVVCRDTSGKVLNSSSFEKYVVIGEKGYIDWTARIKNEDSTYTKYLSIQAAVDAVSSDGKLTRIEVMRSHTLLEPIDIPANTNKNILLTDDGSGTYTVSRGFSSDRMIILRTGNQMTLEGSSKNDATPTLIFDGSYGETSSLQQIITVGTTTTNKNAALTLNAGVKLANSSSSDQGGAVNVFGNLVMNGGLISGNTSMDHGGAIAIKSTGAMTIKGGSIEGNQCVGSKNKDAGAIYIAEKGSLTIEGGTIRENNANSGGAILTYGKVTVTGGNISNNTANANGGAIFVHAKGSIDMTGGTVTENNGNKGGAIYIHQNDSGSGTVTISGGTISNNAAKDLGDDVSVSGGNMVMQDAAYVGSIYLAENKNITIPKALTARDEMTEIVLSTYDIGRQVLTGDAISESYMLFDVPAHMYLDVDSEGKLAVDNQNNPKYAARIKQENGVYIGYETLQAAVNAVPFESSKPENATRIEILQNISLTSSLDMKWKANSYRNILITDDGQGSYTITRAFAGGRMIILRDGNQLTLQGTGGESSQTLIFDGNQATYPGNNNDSQIIAVGTNATSPNAVFILNAGVKLANNSNRNGGGMAIVYSTFIMNGGVIENNKSTNDHGGAIFVHGTGSFTMNAGTIRNNSVTGKTKHGGAVYLYKNNNGAGTMTMSGGTISGNSATGNGGGVGMANAANSLTMTGGSITGNTATGTGADIQVTGALKMQGSAFAGTVYLPTGKTISLTGALTDRTTVTNVIMQTYALDTSVLTGNSVGTDYNKFAVPVESGYVIGKNGTLVN